MGSERAEDAPARSRRRPVIAIVLVTAAFAAMATAPLTTGATGAIGADDGPDPVPAAYFGTLTADGEPIPAGVTVTAEIGGEVRGSVVTSGAGRFGGAGAFDSKLKVDGDSSETGSTVRFFVDGVETLETVRWQPGSVESVDLTVSAAWDGGDGVTGPGGGIGGGGGGVPVRPPIERPGTEEPTDGPAVVDVRADLDRPGTTLASVTGGVAGRSTVIDLRAVDGRAGADVDEGPISATAIELVPAVDGDFTLRIATSTSPPNGATDAGADDGPFGYVTVDHSIADRDVDDVRIGFAVDGDALSDRDVQPSSVALYRHTNDGWNQLPTVRVDAVDDRHRFESESTGLSTFAVATDRWDPAGQGGDDDAVVERDDAGGSMLDDVPVTLLVLAVAVVSISVGALYRRTRRN